MSSNFRKMAFLEKKNNCKIKLQCKGFYKHFFWGGGGGKGLCLNFSRRLIYIFVCNFSQEILVIENLILKCGFSACSYM